MDNKEKRPDRRFIHLRLMLPIDSYSDIASIDPVAEAIESIRRYGHVDDGAGIPFEDRDTVNIILYYGITNLEYLSLRSEAKKAKVPIRIILNGEDKGNVRFKVPLALKMHRRKSAH